MGTNYQEPRDDKIRATTIGKWPTVPGDGGQSADVDVAPSMGGRWDEAPYGLSNDDDRLFRPAELPERETHLTGAHPPYGKAGRPAEPHVGGVVGIDATFAGPTENYTQADKGDFRA